MVIRFYDFEFNLIHIEPKFVNSSWRIYFNDAGTFEAHFPIESEVSAVVAKNKYLVAVQGDFSAIITGYDTKEDFAVFGRTCNWILTKRISLPFEETQSYAGIIASKVVSGAFSDVGNFYTDTKGLGKVITFIKDSAATVFEVVTECLNGSSIGHEVRFDIQNKKWIFRTFKPNETSLIISEALKNASDTAITADILDMADCGYYTKKTEDDEGNTTEELTLLDSGGKSGIYRWEALLSGSSESEAENSLLTKKENSILTLSTHGIFYGEDYSLGDTVRVQITKGALKRTEKRRISGVEVQYRDAAKFEQPVFEEV